MNGPTLLKVSANGLNLRVWEWNAQLRGAEPTLVLVHATGFHGRCWDSVIPHLGQRHVLAVDQRGHGGSDAVAFASWADFCADLAALLETLQVSQAVGVGHSMGGHATVGAAAVRPESYQRLVLIDPVILAPDYYRYPEQTSPVTDPVDHPVARRRSHFVSAEEMLERYDDRPPFCHFTPDSFAAYCHYALVQDPKAGDMKLACDPLYEATIYHTVSSNPGILQQVSQCSLPVHVVRAIEPPSAAALAGFRYSPTWPRLAAHFPQAQDHYHPELSHFMPMEAPEWVAGMILAPDRVKSREVSRA